jgi:hypothetical protein
VSAFIALLLLGGPSRPEAWAQAQKLAAAAAAAPEKEKPAAVERALAAYGAILSEWPKDRKGVPKARRRRAALLRSVGRISEAVSEHDLIVEGRASRYDRARALLDGAVLLAGAGDLSKAAKRCARARERFGDEDSIAVRAALLQGRCFEKMTKPGVAARIYREVTERHRHRVKEAIEAYDRLALLALARKDTRRARRWLTTCMSRYGKKAVRKDRFGRYVARLLGDMKAPGRLNAEQR